MNSRNKLIIICLILSGFALRPQIGFGQVLAGDGDEPDLPALLAVYRSWGLPLPPSGAKLVAHHRGLAVIDGQMREQFELGFRIQTKPDEDASILIGTELILEDGNWNRVDTADIEPDKVSVNQRRIFPYNAAPATAIQLEAMGAHSVALALFKEGMRASPRVAPANPRILVAVTNQPGNLSPKGVLAYAAWAHWAIALHVPSSDRAAIARRMEELAGFEPALAKDEPKSALLESIKATLRPSQSTPWTIDAMIDDLTEVGGDAGVNRSEKDELWNDPQYLKLALRGFEAVPALIQHLSDTRITRAVHTGPNMTVPLHLCVGDLASRIIKNLAGSELPPGWLSDRERLTPEHEATAARWWASASREHEEEYLLAHVFPPQPQGTFRRPYELMLRIIAIRYPTRLPSLYSEMVTHRDPTANRAAYLGLPSISDLQIANIMADSALPPDEKITVLLRAAEHPTSTLADASLAALSQFPQKDVEKIKATLQKKP